MDREDLKEYGVAYDGSTLEINFKKMMQTLEDNPFKYFYIKELEEIGIDIEPGKSDGLADRPPNITVFGMMADRIVLTASNEQEGLGNTVTIENCTPVKNKKVQIILKNGFEEVGLQAGADLIGDAGRIYFLYYGKNKTPGYSEITTTKNPPKMRVYKRDQVFVTVKNAEGKNLRYDILIQNANRKFPHQHYTLEELMPFFPEIKDDDERALFEKIKETVRKESPAVYTQILMSEEARDKALLKRPKIKAYKVKRVAQKVRATYQDMSETEILRSIVKRAKFFGIYNR